MSDDEPFRKRALRSALWCASLACWFAPLLVYAGSFRDQPNILYGFLALTVGGLVSTLVHEIGHAATALACGWRIVTFAVRPFGWQVPSRSFAFVPRRYRKGLSGWVAAVPRASDDRAKMHWSRIIAAGPMASLILAAASFAAMLLLPGPSDSAFIDPKGLALGFMLQSLYTCVFTILPAVRPGGMSDGTQWRALRKADERYSRDKAIVWMNTLLVNKVRIRALPGWMVDEAEQAAEAREDISPYVATVRVAQVLDAETVDVARARHLIERFRVTHATPALDEWLASCDAYVAAVWENDAVRAKARLVERGGSASSALFRAAEAAVAARTGDKALMRSKLKAMWAALRLESPFRDDTYRTIDRRIRALLA
ncbi:M50 family metallopeptidase [Sphingomonas sp. CGMCC 1.13654]|uniref:M50 family metallopeptidase n=1 Tax=Sphingomonas chungangi TaxID=2683589 RepID=A0A838L3V6_9SPHN|nr:M50 family metallopeptidase [Sphingomonas chungangi]MBA2933089.1 M50 family metallopeptidase [Sphingomonas chungangi]MVW56709.1 hypothetical protein [Sphingomonas chungangi]